MKTVFLLEHLHIHSEDKEDVKAIGIYTSHSNAQAAIGRLVSQSGFSQYPKLINPEQGESGSGFYIDEYELNHDNWKEGFGV